MKVAIAADHAGLPLRPTIADAVSAAGHEPLLYGPDTAPPEGIDYPLVAKAVADALDATDAERGILVCGSGAGVTIAANKLPGMRAAYAADHYTGHQMVEHDHVNVLTLGARVIGAAVAAEIVEAFVNAVPSTEERHLRRLGEVLDFERERSMNAATRLHDAGQSLWLDNITRTLLTSGTLARYIADLAVTGLTSNPTIFDKALAGSPDYDEQIRSLLAAGTEGEDLFFELALVDLTKAASLFRATWDATRGVDVASVASVFIPRWDAAVTGKLPDDLSGQLGVAVAKRTYKAYRDLLASDRWQTLAAAGATPQRLLWASTGTKDPNLPDTFYIHALASEKTINTMPEKTLLAFGEHGAIGDLLPADGGDAEHVLARIGSAGVDVEGLAATLQTEGADAFVKSWDDLLARIASRSDQVRTAS